MSVGRRRGALPVYKVTPAGLYIPMSVRRGRGYFPVYKVTPAGL